MFCKLKKKKKKKKKTHGLISMFAVCTTLLSTARIVTREIYAINSLLIRCVRPVLERDPSGSTLVGDHLA